jgi:hypothetical protein
MKVGLTTNRAYYGLTYPLRQLIVAVDLVSYIRGKLGRRYATKGKRNRKENEFPSDQVRTKTYSVLICFKACKSSVLICFMFSEDSVLIRFMLSEDSVLICFMFSRNSVLILLILWKKD